MARKQVTGAELMTPGRVEETFQELYEEDMAAERTGRATFLSKAREEMSKLVKRLVSGPKSVAGAANRR